MTDFDIRCDAARQDSANAVAARQRFFEKGPHISTDGTSIIIPSPYPHPARHRLAKAGFSLWRGDPAPYWHRELGRWSAQQWLDWARGLE